MHPAPVAPTRMGLDFGDELTLMVATHFARLRRARDRHWSRVDCVWRGGLMDPNPDYDGSDEIEYFFRYLTWGLRGVEDGNGYPPPAYPPV